LKKFTFYSCLVYQNFIRNLLIVFLLIFLSHYTYKTINTFNNVENVTFNIGEYDGEEENNNESENEEKELDEYTVDSNASIFKPFNNLCEDFNDKNFISNEFREVDSPPPV
tara:strand:+ start:7622 stop:7954 length:333 start_codon:yes stop_codon:yes gene_type:complete